MSPEEQEYPEAKDVLALLEEAVEFAETLAFPPTDRQLAARVGEELIPALYEARTYLEVGYVRSPEVRLNISRASLVASDLADFDRAFASLHSKLRVLQEEASMASRGAE